jgi:osmotically-inducible protein OsmY
MDAGKLNAASNNARLRRKAMRALRGDLRLDVAGLDVATAGGAITLRGSVPNPLQKATALDLLHRLGCANVVDELRVEPASPSPDHEIDLGVRRALVNDPRVNEKDVSVEVRDGVVMLTGLVDSPAHRAFVEEDIWPLPGIVAIEDAMATLPAPRRADPAVAADVSETLRANPWINDRRVAVDVRDQVVTLHGTVRNREQKRLAGDAARWVPGVREVNDVLNVAA